MLLQAFTKIDQFKRQNKLKLKKYKLLTADAHDLPFDDNTFDSVVETFVLESVYDVE
jgi:ubiquinone/menaquinone biosynthesis C-methylase UbiE